VRITDDGLGAVKRREGVVLTMYHDSAGLPTIGVGHLLTHEELTTGKLRIEVDWHQGITEAQAEDLLRQDLAAAEEAVSEVTVPLTQQQYDTLVSFAFNVGGQAFRASTLLRLLNAGQYQAVPAQLRRWIHSAGRVDPVLVRRREDEVRQWMG
jgi:lysozyme